MSLNLNYKSYGEGKPMFILHGLFGSNRNWSGIARHMATEFQVITVDLRNHGDSDHADSMSYPEMAEDLVTLAQSLGHSTINVSGHSMGGKTAMVLSMLYPALIEKLIVVDIAPVTYQSNHDDLISVMQSLPINTITSRTEADELLSNQITDPGLRQFLLQNLIRNKDGFLWRINLNAIEQNHLILRDYPEKLANNIYTGPTLFIAGGKSDYIKPEHHCIIKELFPNATHKIIENANHWVHADEPEEFIRILKAFVM